MTTLSDDFGEVLRQNGYLEVADEASFKTKRHFLSLYVLTITHGSALLMENGDLAHLQAGFRNKEAKLEVKAHLVSQDLSKPVIVPLCLYWTSLEAQHHCEPMLLGEAEWSCPLDIGSDGLLCVAK